MPAVSATRYLVQAGWDHVPHLSEKAKADLRASTLPHLLDARSKGIPSIGAGAIYPIDLESILFIVPRRMLGRRPSQDSSDLTSAFSPLFSICQR